MSRSEGQLPEDSLISMTLMFRAMNDLGFGGAVCRVGGEIDAADELFETILGRSLAELQALPEVTAALPPDERHLVSELGNALRAGAEVPACIETVVINAAGERVPVQLLLVPMDDTVIGDRSSSRVLVLLRDRRPDLEQHKVLAQFTELWSTIPMGVVIHDVLGAQSPSEIVLRFANAAASRAFGRDLAPLVGRPSIEVFSGPHAMAFAERAWLMSGTDTVEHFADITLRVDGESRIYRQLVVALPGGSVAFLLDDVTNARLDQSHRQQLMKRVVERGDAERRSIALGVHDDPIQQLAAASLLVDAVRRNPDSPTANEFLRTVEMSLRTAMTSLRHLVFELSPPELIESGLAAALRSAIEYLFADVSTNVEMICDDWMRLPVHVEMVAFRLALEAITNARRHAQCANLIVEVDLSGDTLCLSVRDDGVGFAPGSKPGHLGLVSMIERAQAEGGSCIVESSSAGTHVTAVLPVAEVGTLDAPGRSRVTTFAPLPPDGVVRVESVDLDELTALRHQVEGLERSTSDAIGVALQARQRMSAVFGLLDEVASSTAVGDGYLAGLTRAIGSTIGDACAIRICSPDGHTLVCRASWHSDPLQLEFLHRIHLRDVDTRRSTHAGTVFSTCSPILRQASAAPWPESDDIVPDGCFQPMSAMAVPVAFGGTAVGVITVIRDVTNVELDEADLTDLQAVAQQVGVALVARGIVRVG